MKHEDALRGLRVLVVEDEALIAEMLNDAFTGAGAHVVGPVHTLEDAMAALAGGCPGLDAAVLDVNLVGVMSFPAAVELEKCGVPFIFATGYAAQTGFPPREHAKTVVLAKPYMIEDLFAAVAQSVAASRH